MLGIFKNYVNKRIELLKLDITGRTSNLVSILIVFFIILISMMMFLFFISLAAGFVIGKWINDLGAGIFIISCIYFLILIILIANYKRIKDYAMKKMIEFQLNHEDYEENQ